MSQCSHRYAKVNNRYMENFDPTQPESFLMYFDVNGLYAYAMSQTLPVGDFKWIEPSENWIRHILEAPEDGMYGYMLEIDIFYPKHLHDLHNDYPFLCEKMKINNSNHEKLVLNLYDKSHYILHYLTLQLAVKNGLQLKKVHRILRFKQSKWLKPFIDFNTDQRKNAKNDFDVKLYKYFSNSVYGKSIENVKKRRDVKLINKWDGRYGAKIYIAKPNFKKLVIFNENLVAIELSKSEIKLNKPVAVGVCVLEISKIKMYDFHYNFMLKNYSHQNCRIHYTDTDSFVYRLIGNNIYDLIKKHPEQFDTSNYAIDNPYGIEQKNKQVHGLMKDENKGLIMNEFVGLRAKMYCYKVITGRVEKRAKGVKRAVLRKKLSFQQYYDCILQGCSVTDTQATIKSVKHKLYSISQQKRMLDPFDDKRLILQDKIDTRAWGHYKNEQ